MKFKVYVVEINELSPSVKRRIVGGAVFLLVGGASAVVFAKVPHEFVDGEVLSAANLNADFRAIDGRIARIESASPSAADAGEAGAPAKWIVTAGTRTYSMGATYCGMTAPTAGAFSSGPLTGYSAAKAQCEATCGSPSAHMCTTDDMTRSMQLQVGPPDPSGPLGWTATGAAALFAGTQYTYDCSGWTSASSDVRGGSFNAVRPGGNECNTPAPIFCCD